MADVNLSPNLSDIVKAFPPEITQSFGNLITILKAASIIFIIYIIFLIVSAFLDMKSKLRIKRMDEKLDRIESNLDKLVKHKK